EAQDGAVLAVGTVKDGEEDVDDGDVPDRPVLLDDAQRGAARVQQEDDRRPVVDDLGHRLRIEAEVPGLLDDPADALARHADGQDAVALLVECAQAPRRGHVADGLLRGAPFEADGVEGTEISRAHALSVTSLRRWSRSRRARSSGRTG